MDARIGIHYRFGYTFFSPNKKNVKTCFLARMLDTIPYAMENQTKASHSFSLRQIFPRIASVLLWLSVFCFDECLINCSLFNMIFKQKKHDPNIFSNNFVLFRNLSAINLRNSFSRLFGCNE